ncbi:predicted protein [Arabidopsis lyrata subsp. lyrata]|uniref:Predicted protein n=1 Tax=Arabidopsis lyrata subsp. lyrata TaxID=81972 RepID=D7LG16_ARALL|nr:predicted protein [Arabidopsis lyrata subsp. lyrata]
MSKDIKNSNTTPGKGKFEANEITTKCPRLEKYLCNKRPRSGLDRRDKDRAQQSAKKPKLETAREQTGSKIKQTRHGIEKAREQRY